MKFSSIDRSFGMIELKPEISYFILGRNLHMVDFIFFLSLVLSEKKPIFWNYIWYRC